MRACIVNSCITQDFLCDKALANVHMTSTRSRSRSRTPDPHSLSVREHLLKSSLQASFNRFIRKPENAEIKEQYHQTDRNGRTQMLNQFAKTLGDSMDRALGRRTRDCRDSLNDALGRPVGLHLHLGDANRFGRWVATLGMSGPTQAICFEAMASRHIIIWP